MISCSGGSSCRHAIHPGCVCACGGANHGMDRLRWAYARMAESKRPSGFGELTSADVQRYQDVAVRRGNQAQSGWTSMVIAPLRQGTSARRPKFTNKMGEAAARKIADDDAVRWLAQNPPALADVQFLSKQIGQAAEEALKSLPEKGQRRRLADHFWCDVVGALVRVLEEIDGAVEKLTDKAIDWLVEEVWRRVRGSRTTDRGSTPNGRRQPVSSRADRDRGEDVTEQVLKTAIKSLLKNLSDGLTAKRIAFDALILKLRLLAIWLCPAILGHRLVWEHCWIPLARGWVEEYVQGLLEGVFPNFAAVSGPAEG